MKKEQGFILSIIIVIVVVAVLGAAGYFVYKQYSAPKPIACTQEAKLCPDGSSVGRTGPNCEFTPCPDQTAGWQTFDSGDGFEFKYPVLNSFIAFSEPGIVRSNSDINNDGCYLGHENNIIPPNPVSEKEKVTINNINFCISKTSDSAMGHSSPTYLYTTTYKNAPENHFTIILPFDVTACDNLKGGSNYKLCQDFFSNSSNNTDKIANSIISTIRFFSN